MVDTKTPGDKTLSVPTKTLSLKPRVETGTVRQSFSHGRTKQVVVEKRGKRRVGGDAPANETHAPEPAPAKVAAPAPAARSSASARSCQGRVPIREKAPAAASRCSRARAPGWLRRSHSPYRSRTRARSNGH